MQGNRVEAVRLSVNEWTRCDILSENVRCAEFLTGELSGVSIIRMSIILSTDKNHLPCTFQLLVTVPKYYTEYCR
jgi:hypothetical protein